MLTSESIMKEIEKNMDKIKKFGVKKIGLFGSYVQNNQTEESDLDLLVEFEKGQKSFDNYMDLKFFLERLFNHRVDLVITGAIKPDLKPYILGNVQYVPGL